MRGGPPFFTVRGAVRWAYFTAGRLMLKNSSIYNKAASRSFVDGALTHMDRRTQAALIVGITERLVDPLEAAYISVVWLAPWKLTRTAAARRREMRATLQVRKVTCQEPAKREELPFYFRQDADPESWKRLVDDLRRHKSLPSKGLEKLVRRICGESIGVHACRKDLRCDLNRVVEIESEVRMMLDRLQDQVRERLEPTFVEKGLVLPSTMY